MKVFIIDQEKCNGCYGCQLVCKDEHVDNDWMPIAKPQPDTGHFWMRLNEVVHGQVPKVKLEYRATPCMHCDNAACMDAGDDTVYKREDGLVIIDPTKAAGRKDLAERCPYGAIYWNEALNLPQKCTGCAHLVDEGKPPRCVEACSVGALRFGEEVDFADELAQAEVMLPEKGLKPRVYYLNAPKLFVAGEVYDPDLDESLIGAEVTLTNNVTGQSLVEITDTFGDYWFKKLEAGHYSIKVAKQGYKSFELNSINVKESLKIADIALNK